MQTHNHEAIIARRYDLFGYALIGMALLGFLYFTTFFGPLTAAKQFAF